METISTAELIELILLELNLMDSQFQYWVSVSFAVIVASFIARERLSKRTRYLSAILYLSVSGAFFFRYVGAADHLDIMMREVAARGVVPPLGSLALYFRAVGFFAGLVTAIWFLVRGFGEHDARAA